MFESGSTLGKIDKIKLSVNPTDIELVRESNDLVLRLIDTTDTLRVESYFAPDVSGQYSHKIDQLLFSNGTIWTSSKIEEIVSLNDLLIGGADRDIWYGEAGSDRLDGGSGPDELYGNQDSDNYVLFGRGYGKDFVYDGNGQSEDVDTV